jgi:hypothetical protein
VRKRSFFFKEAQKKLKISQTYGLLPSLYRKTVAFTTSNPVVLEFRNWIDKLLREHTIIYNSLPKEQIDEYNPITPQEIDPKFPPVRFIPEDDSSESSEFESAKS